MYLQDRIVPPDDENAGPNNFDVLKWWSRNQERYPLFAIMAREIFGVQASTVAVEQAFSESGYMLDERRSNLTPDHLEAQMMLKDESKADLSEQENHWDDLMDGPLIEVGSESEAEGGSQTGDDWDDDFKF
ncbi:hypothetical protein C2S52_020323 [Perilla frutescens var. hirtella]|nr:hypothetical protein C2S52_020323 [Perilla frutescens var. hirtella]KAH6805541.1 hypothetical protein C2S51_030372 [Perilla frutescens var. frutescens]